LQFIVLKFSEAKVEAFSAIHFPAFCSSFSPEEKSGEKATAANRGYQRNHFYVWKRLSQSLSINGLKKRSNKNLRKLFHLLKSAFSF